MDRARCRTPTEDARVAFDLFADGLQLYLAGGGLLPGARGCWSAATCAAAEAVLARVDAGPAAGRHVRRLARGGGRAGWPPRGATHAAALEAFLACGERLGGAVVNPALFHWRSGAALAALQTGDRALAERLAARRRALAERLGRPRAVGVARRAAGLLARGEAAVELLAAAVDAARAAAAPRVEHALSLTELGGAVRRAGRPGEARGAAARGDRAGRRRRRRAARRPRAPGARARGRPRAGAPATSPRA